MDGTEPRTRIERVLQDARETPARYRDASALASAAGTDLQALAGFVLEHHHLAPADWLQRARLAAARKELRRTHWRDAAEHAGYPRAETFASSLRRHCGLAPETYALLGGQSQYVVQLPRGYRSAGVRGLLGRDGESATQGLIPAGIWKSLVLAGKPVRMTIEFASGAARVALAGNDSRLSSAAARESVEPMRRLLGLGTPRPSSRALGTDPWRRLPGTHAGFYPARYAHPFEALTWAIVGQQINLGFAATLVRRLTQHFSGSRVLALMPTAAQLAEAVPERLTKLQLSRAKADTLVRVARCIVTADLDLDRLPNLGVPATRSALVRLKGIGPWTAEYLALRGFGFADCLPVGDAGLAAGVRAAFALPERPSAATIEKLAKPFAPYRSLATHFLWRSTL